MPIGGSATELNITGAKLKVAGGVQVAGSLSYTTDATGFGSVTAQIDNNNTLNITSGKNTGVAKIERSTAATITAITHTNVNNNTTIHLALKNTATSKGVFITLGTFSTDDTVKVNYTDNYLIGPGETGMVTLRKVNGVLSLFVREMFTSKATNFDNTDNSPFYIKDGVNYKYPLYKFAGSGLTSEVIQGTEYFRPSTGITTQTRPPKGLPENVVSPTGTLKIGNDNSGTTIYYDVYGVSDNFNYGSIYRSSTKKVSFVIENGQASGSFTDSGVSTGQSYSLYIDGTDTSVSDTISFSGFNGTLAFHHDTFANGGDPYGDGSVTAAAAKGHVYSDTAASSTYGWGTLTTPSYDSSEGTTTYTWTPTSGFTGTQTLLVAGGGGGGGNYFTCGGGGAGGYVYYASQDHTGAKTIVIGDGGSGGDNSTGVNGKDTTFTGLTTAVGGGFGSAYTYTTGGSGGSGGGGGYNGSNGNSNASGQGHSGAGSSGAEYAGGGGGGGGSAGSTTTGGQGKDYTSVFGTSYGDKGFFVSGGGGCGRGGGYAYPGGGGQGRGQTTTTLSRSDLDIDGQKHTGGGGGAWANVNNGTNKAGKGGSGIVLVKTTTGTLKNIPKVTGISFTSSNIVFTVQQDSGNSITHVKYTINGGSEVSTAVGTLSVAHSLSASAAISVVAWAVDTSGNQLGVKKTVTGTVPS
uniref:Glycine-rich domain-containing protein n=1 Tax=Bathycoccus sp. RCC716 virus 2 TaxID=2530039 RepID=A0A7S6NYC5_9PHYC|nr:hypothetical protein [Bathycoccus sp. RCC716 virus 2]